MTVMDVTLLPVPCLRVRAAAAVVPLSCRGKHLRTKMTRPSLSQGHRGADNYLCGCDRLIQQSNTS